MDGDAADDPHALLHLFAPDNTRIYKVKPKTNLWGIGYDPLDDAEDVRTVRDRNRARERQHAALVAGADSQRRVQHWPCFILIRSKMCNMF